MILRDYFLEFAPVVAYRRCTDHSSDWFSSSEDHQGGYASYVISSRDVRVSVDVQPQKSHPIIVLFRKFVDGRGYQPAWSAPVCVKVHKGEKVGPDHFLERFGACLGDVLVHSLVLKPFSPKLYFRGPSNRSGMALVSPKSRCEATRALVHIGAGGGIRTHEGLRHGITHPRSLRLRELARFLFLD